jgi:GNAT superfamily N-acetyltransferase
MSQDLPQLFMERPSLADLPPLAPPPGGGVRSYQAGDEAAWVAIVNDAFGFDHPAEWFWQRLGDGQFRPERVWFATLDGQPVATAAAWLEPDRWDQATGVLHMVAALAAHRGRGLGRLACLAALHQLAAEGRARVRLRTDDHRLPAIRVYRGLGFEPFDCHESHAGRWAAIERELGRGERH